MVFYFVSSVVEPPVTLFMGQGAEGVMWRTDGGTDGWRDGQTVIGRTDIRSDC